MKYMIFTITKLWQALLIIFITIITFTASPTYAQFNIANVYDISDPEIKEGDILIFDPEKGLQKASLPYDSHLFGIFQKQPGIVFKRADDSGKPVVRSGIAKVNVNLSNGEIKKGDSITSSTSPGLGMKASSPGYVVGIALEDAKEDEDQIDVAIDIRFKDLTGVPFSLKNILAALIILLSMIFAWIIFNRVMPRTIEAIGRNPLAKRSIELSLILIVIIVIAIVVGAIVGAILILKLTTI